MIIKDFGKSKVLFFEKGIGKMFWNKQTEPQGYPKAYKSTSRVKFVYSKWQKRKTEKIRFFNIMLY